MQGGEGPEGRDNWPHSPMAERKLSVASGHKSVIPSATCIGSCGSRINAPSGATNTRNCEHSPSNSAKNLSVCTAAPQLPHTPSSADRPAHNYHKKTSRKRERLFNNRLFTSFDTATLHEPEIPFNSSYGSISAVVSPGDRKSSNLSLSVLNEAPASWHRTATMNSLRKGNPKFSTPVRFPPNIASNPNARNCLVWQSSDASSDRNPLVEVSNEYMRATGFAPPQFKTLLRSKQFSVQSDGGKRRQNGPLRPLNIRHSNAKIKSGLKPDSGAVAPQTKQESSLRRKTESEVHKEQQVLRYRLGIRKRLFWKRTKICDLSAICTVFGIFLMIVESELKSGQMKEVHAQSNISGGAGNIAYFYEESWQNTLLKSLILLSTIVLLGFIFLYHAAEVQIIMIESGTDDWRVAVTWSRVLHFFVEELICVVCPMPGTSVFSWSVIEKDKMTVKTVLVPMDVILAMPMFLRCYLICRWMVLHSKLFQDAATRSIAALNHVTVDFKFVLKTMMTEEPLRVLLTFTLVWWIALSWLMTQCERYNGYSQDLIYMNCLWFIIITFMSIGYGDVVPKTYCGRSLAIGTGIVGIGVASALIAVISRKMELSRAERHVNAFITDTKLAKLRKDAAASVLQETWFIYRYRNLEKRDHMKVRVHQRRFLAAINEFRQVKWEIRKLAEQSHSLIDVAKIESEVREGIVEMQRCQSEMLEEINSLASRMNDLHFLVATLCQNSAVDLNAAPQLRRNSELVSDGYGDNSIIAVSQATPESNGSAANDGTSLTTSAVKRQFCYPTSAPVSISLSDCDLIEESV